MTERDFSLIMYAFFGGVIADCVFDAATRATPTKFPLLALTVGGVGLYLCYAGCRKVLRGHL